MFHSWEGNRRSGVAQAMRHRLSGLSTYRLKGKCVGDEHPTYAPLEYGPPLAFTVLSGLQKKTEQSGALCRDYFRKWHSSEQRKY